jgi:hypothetical protein
MDRGETPSNRWPDISVGAEACRHKARCRPVARSKPVARWPRAEVRRGWLARNQGCLQGSLNGCPRLGCSSRKAAHPRHPAAHQVKPDLRAHRAAHQVPSLHGSKARRRGHSVQLTKGPVDLHNHNRRRAKQLPAAFNRNRGNLRNSNTERKEITDGRIHTPGGDVARPQRPVPSKSLRHVWL